MCSATFLRHANADTAHKNNLCATEIIYAHSNRWTKSNYSITFYQYELRIMMIGATPISSARLKKCKIKPTIGLLVLFLCIFMTASNFPIIFDFAFYSLFIFSLPQFQQLGKFLIKIQLLSYWSFILPLRIHQFINSFTSFRGCFVSPFHFWLLFDIQ